MEGPGTLDPRHALPRSRPAGAALAGGRWGAIRLWHALRLVLGDSGLRRAAALPTLLALLACAAVATLLTWLGEEVKITGLARLHTDGAWAALGLAWGSYWIVVDALELPIEVLPGPPPPAPALWFTRALVRVGGLFFLLRPARWAGRLAGRLSRPRVEEIHFTERNPWECAGFGLAAAALLAVPVLGLLFRAVAITGATALVGALGDGGGPAGGGVPERLP